MNTINMCDDKHNLFDEFPKKLEIYIQQYFRYDFGHNYIYAQICETFNFNYIKYIFDFSTLTQKQIKLVNNFIEQTCSEYKEFIKNRNSNKIQILKNKIQQPYILYENRSNYSFEDLELYYKNKNNDIFLIGVDEFYDYIVNEKYEFNRYYNNYDLSIIANFNNYIKDDTLIKCLFKKLNHNYIQNENVDGYYLILYRILNNKNIYEFKLEIIEKINKTFFYKFNKNDNKFNIIFSPDKIIAYYKLLE